MRTALGWVDRQGEMLNPGYFALVMATGIISNAMRLEGREALSDALFWFNLAAYPWLWLLTILRLVRNRRALFADLVNPELVFAFFTTVAGTGVLGVGLNLRGYHEAAAALWLLAFLLWFVLIYFSFGVLTFLNSAQGASVVHGGWLNAIVGTQSLVILGTLVAPTIGGGDRSIFVLLHMLWGVGLGLYGIFITLFAYQIFSSAFRPEDISPLLWVVMGAAAISTNAGSTLLLNDSGVPFLQSVRPFIDGVTVIMWAWATWWIPLLLLFGFWKHGVKRAPLTYNPALWSLVFPLGMYAVASLRLSLAADVPLLRGISHAIVWIALAVWAATLVGLVNVTVRRPRAPA